MERDKRDQVESRLGRQLQPEELVPVATFDDLTTAQLEVIARLFDLQAGVTAINYVSTVIPRAEPPDVQRFVMNFDKFIARKRSSPMRLRAEHVYEHGLGRHLTEDERSSRDSLESLSLSQLEVARVLSKQDLLVAHAYLGEIVMVTPAASMAWQEACPGVCVRR